MPTVDDESVELLTDWEGVVADEEDSSAAHPKIGMIALIAIITSKTSLWRMVIVKFPWVFTGTAQSAAESICRVKKDNDNELPSQKLRVIFA